MELISTSLGQMIVAIFVVINTAAFWVMAYDKRKAVRGYNAERTPEGVLFFMAALFGSGGVYLGMFIFRHKIRTWYFQLGIPLLILQNAATVYLVWEMIQML